MGYAIGNEFPNVCGEYPDITELLCLYRKLTSEYTDLLKQITDTNAKLDDYMQNIETMIPGWIDTATKEQQERLNQLANRVEAEINKFSKDINDLIAEYNARLDVQFKNQMNKVNASISYMTTWVTNQIKEMKIWVKEQNIKLRNYVDAIDRENQNVHDLHETMIEAVGSRVSALQEEFTRQSESITKRITDWFNVFQLWYYRNRWEDKEWLAREIQKMQDTVDSIPESSSPVYNPIRNAQTSFNQAIMDMFDYGISSDGYEAGEWDISSWITCRLFDTSPITAITFTTDAKHVLDGGWRKLRMFSPVTGQYVWIGTAIQQVFDALNPNGTTASEYDNTQTTAEAYDGRDVTASDYLRKRWLDVQ